MFPTFELLQSCHCQSEFSCFVKNIVFFGDEHVLDAIPYLGAHRGATVLGPPAAVCSKNQVFDH